MDDHFRSVLCSRNLCMDGQYVNLPVPKQLDSLRRCLETTRYWGREPRIYGMITIFSHKLGYKDPKNSQNHRGSAGFLKLSIQQT